MNNTISKNISTYSIKEESFEIKIKNVYKSYIITFIGILVVFGVLMVLCETKTIGMYNQRLIKQVGIFAVAALGLNLILGFTGQFTMGHAAFMSIGAYASTIATKNLNLPFPLALIFGIIVSGIFAGLIGYPILRLKGDYLAICTLGFGEIVKVVIQNIEFLGGARGISGIETKTNMTWVFFSVVACFIIIKNLIHHSSKGRAILSVRDDDIAAEAMGINSTRYKLVAFIIGSGMAGLAGGLYAHFNTFIDPASFNFSKSIEIITYVVLGGMGSLTGTLLGTGILIYLPEALRGLSEVIKEYRMLIYAVMLILMMLFRPQGILGANEITIKGIKNFFQKIIYKISSKKRKESN